MLLFILDLNFSSKGIENSDHDIPVFEASLMKVDKFKHFI